MDTPDPSRPDPTGPGYTPAWRRRAVAVVAAAILACFALRAALTSHGESVTTDEFAHLPAGHAVLLHRDFDVDREAPPLASALAAIPALAARPDFPAAALAGPRAPGAWRTGFAFQEANRERYRALYTGPRLVTTLLGLALAAAVFLWSRRLWGDGAALAALALVAFEPNLVAHAGLVTTEIAFCLATVLALQALTGLLRHGGLAWTLWAGVALGLAQLTKFTAVLIYPAAFIAVMVAARPLRRGLLRLALAAAISLVVLNAGYLGHGTFARLDRLGLQGPLGARLSTLTLPSPLPADYVRGLDDQMRNSAAGFATYLNGRLYQGKAPRYYDLEILLLKTPLAELGLVLLALATLPWAARGEPRLALTLVAATGVLLFVAASLTDLNLGVRYVLLLYPLAAIAVAPLARRLPRLAAAALVLHAAESVASHPHELAFTNLVAGGPEGALAYMAESNLDWGQDLPALAETLGDLGVGHVRLAYFGRVDPRLYGIDFELAMAQPEPGWYAISANFRAGLPYLLFDAGADAGRWAQAEEFAAFAALRPLARAGASMYVYHVPD